MPGILYMSSQSGNDGSYTLTVTFDVNVDLNTALVMVQNRVALAMPILPTPVQNEGITIRKKTPDILLMVNFFSPDGRYDDLYLSNYALIHAKDEILRVDGVSDVLIVGERDYSIRAWLDPQKMALLGMSALDVAKAIRNQNLAIAAGQIGQPPSAASEAFQWPIHSLGRLQTPEQFRNIVIKASPNVSPSVRAAAPSPELRASQLSDPLQAAATATSSASSASGTAAGTMAGSATTNTTAAQTTSTGSSTLTAASGGATRGALAGGATVTGGAVVGGGGTAIGGAPRAAAQRRRAKALPPQRRTPR